VTCEITGEGKVEKKEAKGKDDAKTTYSGRKPRDVKVTLVWLEYDWSGQTAEDAYMREALRELNPAGAKGGEPWELTHVDAELFDVASIMLEKLTIKRDDGTNKATAELTGASWVKPAPQAAGAGKAKTATDPNAWKLGGGASNAGQTLDVKPFGGASPPAVKP
jgi:hypothetical protein